MAKDSDHLFMFIGDRAFTIGELGAAADMRIDKALQHIIDNGLLGEELKGKAWYEVIQPSGIRMDAPPAEEEILLHTLHAKYKTALDECMELSRNGQLTSEKKAQMNDLRMRYTAAKKLSQP